MLSEVFKNWGHTAGRLHGLFSHFHRAVLNSKISDSYRSKLKTECSSGAHVSYGRNGGTQHAHRKNFALSGMLSRSWEPGKAPAQQWLCFAEVVSLWMVYAWLSAALWHLLRKRIICKANCISTSHSKMKVANFKTIPKENPIYTTWHSHAGKKELKLGLYKTNTNFLSSIM